MHSLLWELYELNLCYELYALNQAIVPHLWTASDEAKMAHQTLLYSIFPGESRLVMWLEPLPQDTCDLGLGGSNIKVALPFFNCFHELLSAWPEAPSCLQSPAGLDGQANKSVWNVFYVCCAFYLQTSFDFLGRQPSFP